MNKNILTGLLVVSVIASLVIGVLAYNKSGQAGPQGPKGDAGVQGQKGKTGKQGPRGYASSQAPVTGLDLTVLKSELLKLQDELNQVGELTLGGLTNYDEIGIGGGTLEIISLELLAGEDLDVFTNRTGYTLYATLGMTHTSGIASSSFGAFLAASTSATVPDSHDFVLLDPDKADRTLVLGGEEVVLQAGVENKVKLSGKQLAEMKKKYSYLKVK